MEQSGDLQIPIWFRLVQNLAGCITWNNVFQQMDSKAFPCGSLDSIQVSSTNGDTGKG